MTVIINADCFQDWPVLIEFCTKRPQRFVDYLDMALSTESHYLAGAVRKRIAAGKFLALANRRPRDGSVGSRGTKPLNKTGSLKNSVTAVPEAPDGSLEYFAGIPYASGKVSIARVHEYGATFAVIVTRKMLAYLFKFVFARRRRRKGGQGETSGKWKVGYPVIITIPARPFMRPTLEAETPGSIARIAATMGHHLATYLGALKRAKSRRDAKKA